ncbi:MAG: hypothetical protein KAS65_06985 [Candidatus Aminicenantes bacterium]|nr:hypothetical protein [Candidatus Aminicenantes bacterium]
MTEVLLWLYLENSVLLINHEIDSVYWNEWKIGTGGSLFNQKINFLLKLPL